MHSRRRFIALSSLAGTGVLLPQMIKAVSSRHLANGNNNELLLLSNELLQSWGQGLLHYQVKDQALKGLYGGILCPACNMVHGRCGDAIFPLLYLAHKSNNQQYKEAAFRLYDWMENRVSLPDGSWVNEISVSDWKGITVFGAIALAESLIHFEHLLDNSTRARWQKRLQAAADYLYKNFTIDTGNINYPAAGSYALCLIGNYLHQPHFTEKGKNLAQQCLNWFTPKDTFLYGEGKPASTVSPKGCYSVDLGYNVEESLPSLVLYAQLTNDEKVLDTTVKSLRTHLEFMLPDGGWDNSWGTRNFKWTYWGSRTSDGCQPAYALMAHQEPAFYKAALQNTRLLKACTHENVLYGGPHYQQHGLLPCIAHTLGHSKALATLLVKYDAMKANKPNTIASLPREQEYGVKAFPEVQTWLIAKNKWRATITSYDQEYSMTGGHASGGALTLLWHEKAGPVIVASMNRYQLVESFNMQRDKALLPTGLTPRFEAIYNSNIYSNINDLKAAITYDQTDRALLFTTKSQLVDEKQALFPGAADCEVQYGIQQGVFNIKANYKGPVGKVKYLLPVISSLEEKIWVIAPNKLQIVKPRAIVHIEANIPFTTAGTPNERIFNFVPGMEAVLLEFTHHSIDIKISVT